MLAKHPWLGRDDEVDEDGSFSATMAKRSSVYIPDVLTRVLPQGPLDEDVLVEIYKGLERKRDDWSAAAIAKAGKGAFRMAVRGGEWTMEHKGRAYDALRGFASGEPAEAWCKLYGQTMSADFDVDLYGEEAAMTHYI